MIFSRLRWNGDIHWTFIFFQNFLLIFFFQNDFIKNFFNKNFLNIFFQLFCFLTEEAMFSWEQIRDISVSVLRIVYVIFSWLPDVWVCVCFRFLTFQTPIIHKPLENWYEFWCTSEAVITLLSWLFSWQLTADLWFYGILNILKNVCGSSNFRKV